MREEELENLIRKVQRRQTEFQTVELKTAAVDFPRRIYDTLSSFSNQDDGGIIIFGVSQEDNCNVVGVYTMSRTPKKKQWKPATRWSRKFGPYSPVRR